MRATSIGHAGILVDTLDGSIACDPWFLPQFHGSWFVFPRNDRLDDELMQRICNPTYLYISHIHADHLDEGWLVEHMNRDTTVLNRLPELARSLGSSVKEFKKGVNELKDDATAATKKDDEKKDGEEA